MRVFALLSVFISMSVMAAVPVSEQPSEVDFEGFMEVSAEVAAYREGRLVGLDRFLDLSEEPNTIILDTRSKWAYDTLHITGAVHLNFSDFTEEKLARVIADKDTRILIYCNNNFFSQQSSLQSKTIVGALNIPTFITLYAYGYQNIYELGTIVPSDEERLSLTVSPALKREIDTMVTSGVTDVAGYLGFSPSSIVVAGTD